jgi:hypothetical protein
MTTSRTIDGLASAQPAQVTGAISHLIQFTEDIAAVTRPTAGTAGTTTSTLDHLDSITSGQKFEFDVPDDYDSGDIDINCTYAMSTAFSGNIRLETTAEIARPSTGSIDSSSYPATTTTLSVPATTDVTKEAFLTISSDDFQAGDHIVVLVKRVGGDGLDTHTGNWRLIAYTFTYTGQLQARNVSQFIALFSDTDETRPVPGTISSFNTLDFYTGVDREQKFEVLIPEHWDSYSDGHVRLLFAMSTAVDANVKLETAVEVANVTDGTYDAYSAESFIIDMGADTDPHRTVVVRSIPVSAMHRGDHVTIKLARRGVSGDDTHTGAFQLLSAHFATGISPTSGAIVSPTQQFIQIHDFKEVSGTVYGDLLSPDFAGDFETWAEMSSDSAVGRIDVAYQGRLRSDQTTISEIQIAIKGSVTGSQYQVKVYVDGQGSSQVYSLSALESAETSRTKTLITSSELNYQPTGDGRYFIVVEATLDTGELLYVGRPFVKQE